jgi:hypothetical protein
MQIAAARARGNFFISTLRLRVGEFDPSRLSSRSRFSTMQELTGAASAVPVTPCLCTGAADHPACRHLEILRLSAT